MDGWINSFALQVLGLQTHDYADLQGEGSPKETPTDETNKPSIFSHPNF